MEVITQAELQENRPTGRGEVCESCGGVGIAKGGLVDEIRAHAVLRKKRERRE